MNVLRVLLPVLLTLAMTTTYARDFSEGQVWSYKSRPGEESSTLLINKVESDPQFGHIFHVSLSGVRVKNRHAPSGNTSDLPHFPVSKQTLEASCIQLMGQSKPNPDYLEGYAEWRRAVVEGNAGVFTIPVSEIVEIVESTING